RDAVRAKTRFGEGGFIDEDFNAIDVCIVMPTARLRRRHRDHLERAIQRPMLEPATERDG
ncbi:MAG: hypothetical protein ABI588_07735, partial [Arenimonas sp.]